MWTVRHRSSLRGQGGFTLIEMLIVVAIMGILGGVVALAMGNLLTKTTENACETERRTIETALDAYHVDHDAYPPALADLATGSPHYLKSAPSTAKWTFTSGTDEISGTGRCAGY